MSDVIGRHFNSGSEIKMNAGDCGMNLFVVNNRTLSKSKNHFKFPFVWHSVFSIQLEPVYTRLKLFKSIYSPIDNLEGVCGQNRFKSEFFM